MADKGPIVVRVVPKQIDVAAFFRITLREALALPPGGK